MCNSSVCVCTEVFQLLALHLPQSGDQMVEASQLSVVLEDVSSNPAAVSFSRGVGSSVILTHLTCFHRHTRTPTGYTFTPALMMFCLSEIKDLMWQLKYCLNDVANVHKLNSIVCFSSQGEYIASIKSLQLEVFFFKKQKSYRWALTWPSEATIFWSILTWNKSKKSIFFIKANKICHVWNKVFGF